MGAATGVPTMKTLRLAYFRASQLLPTIRALWALHTIANVTTSQVIPEHILRFMNSLPVTDDPVQWISVFKEELKLLLGDVDRVSVRVDINCNLQNPARHQPTMRIVPGTTSSRDGEKPLTVAAVRKEGNQADRMMEDMQATNFPFEHYHEPAVFTYYFAGQAPLGTIFLWKEIGKEPLSSAIQEAMVLLEPFIVFILSDLVARRRYADPNMGMFAPLDFMINDSSLSKQEQRVVILQLFGHSYKEMADMLGVTVDGIKHHLKMIHRKTGTRSYTELFAKYFLPRLNLENPEE
jgi:DNA-binding CsgD family transcriptional regulator